MRSTFARLTTRARPTPADDEPTSTPHEPTDPAPPAASGSWADSGRGGGVVDARGRRRGGGGRRVPGRVGGVEVRLERGRVAGGTHGRSGEVDDVGATLGAQLGLVEAAMRSAVADIDEGIAATFDRVLARDRARLRARLVLLSAAAVGAGAAPPPAVITAAAAVELLHLAQRHHDTRHHDVRQVGEADVLVGDHLLARAVQLAIAVDAAAGEALGRCVVARVRGQLLDERARYCVDRQRPAYLEASRARTAVLTAAAAAQGARLAGGTDDQVGTLRRYGELLGLALQLTDDLRDVVTDAADTGNDLRTGIYTLPTLAALAEAGELRAVLGRPLDRAALAHATHVVRRSGGVAVALSQIHRQVTEAIGRLDGLPTPAGLDELAHGVGHRAWHLAADQPVVDLGP